MFRPIDMRARLVMKAGLEAEVVNCSGGAGWDREQLVSMSEDLRLPGLLDSAGTWSIVRWGVDVRASSMLRFLDESGIVASVPRLLAHAVFGTRRYMERRVGALAMNCRGLRVLELGSGKRTRGGHAYSVKQMFHPSNDFVQSDVVADYGHRLVDVTTMGFEEEFDLVLCLNVLEHVYDFRAAVRNVHRAVRAGGRAVFGVPAFYPLHDEPSDFWRFTEHGLRRLLADFSHVLIDHHGPRRYPFAYLAVAKK